MKKLTHSKFVSKCKCLNLEPIQRYTKASSKILVKDRLGIIYKVFASSILQGVTPTVMSAVDKKDSFIKRAEQIHGKEFDYSLVKYKNSSTKVEIICKKHGKFLQTPNQHINRKNKCFKCVKRPGGYKKKQWIKSAKISKEMTGFKLYVVKLYNDKESFYKIGRTFRDIERRFRGTIPYDYEVVKIIKGKGNTIYNLENELHKKLRKYKYNPLINFKGCKECYKINNYILDVIQKLIV